MSPERIAEIRARVNKATPGPWTWFHENALGGGTRDPDGEWILVLGTHDAAPCGGGDAALIAHAREDIPALLAEIERLQYWVRQAAGAAP